MDNATIMLIATAPAKVRRFLSVAHDRGLTIAHDDVSYTITSPNPIDDWALWLFYTPGPSGGSLTIRRYIPSNSTHKAKNTKITHQVAIGTIHDMADGLDRHNARRVVQAAEVAQITAARHPETADTDAPAVNVSAVVGALKPNGRFAIRAARHGHIARNTPTKVRAALVRRGLVDVAGGILTDLGRAARQQLISA